MTEFDIQRDIFKRFSHLELMYATASGVKLPMGLIVKCKLCGIIKKGLPDVVLPYARNGYHGMYLELKTETGTPTPEQSFFIQKLKEEGYFATVVFGFNNAVKTIEDYFI
jgi:hypothetical protein